jgi:hypothetical protein
LIDYRGSCPGYDARVSLSGRTLRYQDLFWSESHGTGM